MITTLSQLIAQVESDNNPGALRFEPAFTPSALAIARCVQANKCNQATARVLCAMSFGKYQIMGENLYGLLACPQSVAVFLSDVPSQDREFELFTRRKGIAFTLSDVLTNPALRLKFAATYNGPGNTTAYMQRMLDTYNAHKEV